MAKISLLCFILAEILLINAIAGDHSGTTELVVAGATDRPVSLAPEPPETGEEESHAAEAPEIRRLGKHHVDKSLAGGGVIIGGLVTAMAAAVFCYIRVTRKKDGVGAVH